MAVSQLNDLKVQALRQLGYLDKQLNVNECLFWKTFSNKTEYDDLKKAWLASLGFNKATLVDSYYAYLRSQGYTGSIPDMEWKALISNTLYFSPLTLFAAGEQGAWYDPSDLTSLFQDSAGTTPVTAVEQPVGLMRDKSGRGNHAIQATAASRPVLSARVNRLPLSSSVVAGPAWAANLGAITGGVFIPNNTAGIHRCLQTWNPVVGMPYTVSGTLIPAGVRYVYVNTNANLLAAVCVDVQTGAITGGASSATDISAVKNPDGSVSFQYSGVGQNVTGNNIWFQANGTFVAGDDTTYVGDGIAGIQPINIQIEYGKATKTRYQAVDAAGTYDTSGFPLYLRCDGVDDGMATAGNVDLSLATQITSCVGVRKLGETVRESIFEFSPIYSNIGGFAIEGRAGTPGSFLLGNGIGGAAVQEISWSVSSPVSAVVTGLIDWTAKSSTIRGNGVQRQTLSNSGTAVNSGTYPLYLFRRAGSTLPFTGNFYGLVIRGAASSASQISQLEAYMNAKTGAF